MVAQAVSASREGSIFTRTVRGLFGGSVHRNVPLVVELLATGRARRSPRRSARREPRAARRDRAAERERPDAGRRRRRADGRQRARWAGDRARAGGHGAGAHGRRAAHVVKPTVTTAQLAADYPAYIVIDRSAFRLRFYDHLKLAKTYEIAVGMEGLETPPACTTSNGSRSTRRGTCPKKHGPGALAGTVVPPGPATR